MACVNKLNDTVLYEMRQEVLKLKKQVRVIQQLYQKELSANKTLYKELVKSKKTIQKLQTTCNKFKCMLNNYELKHDQSKKSKKCKHWDEIKSVRTKYRRLNEYRENIFETLQNLDVCHRAEINLWLPDNKIKYSWSPNDFEKCLPSQNENLTPSLVSIMHDHSYGHPKEHVSDHDHLNDVDYSKIFDNEGKWTKDHIRRLIHIMDSFRISHQAYHELRMVSKGHLPPIGKISYQKNIMSETLTYTKHPTVSKHVNII